MASEAASSYAPLRRNSFLQPTTNETLLTTTTALASRLSTFTVGLTLLVLRFWKDARIWRDVVAKLPKRLQVLLYSHAHSWQGTTSGFVKSALKRLLQSLQEQLAPFLQQPLPGSLTTNTIANIKQQQHQRQQHSRVRSRDGSEAPTSIFCCDTTDSSAATVPLTVLSSDYYEDRIRQNHCLIRTVLDYWFGQYEPDTAQKQLWMIASSSTQLRKNVDSEIATLFAPLLCELATASAHSSEDGTLQPCRWKQWCADKELYGYQGKLAAIIVLDQFSRHIRRHNEEQTQQQQQQQQADDTQNTQKGGDKEDKKEEKTDSSTTSTTSTTAPYPNNIPPQKKLDALALRTAQLLTQGHTLEINCGMIPLPQYVFGLMPYRHASTLESVQYVQTCVDQAASLNLQFEGMTSRFRKATNRRMAVLQDEARRMGKATTTTTITTASSLAPDAPTPQEQQQEDQSEWEPIPPSPPSSPARSVAFCEEDILETFPFEADMTDAHDHPVVRTIEGFLTKRGIYPTAAPATYAGKEKEKEKNNGQKKRRKTGKKKPNGQKQQPYQEHSESSNAGDARIMAAGEATADSNATPATACSIIVSLSGGVDSMVIAAVLAFLKKHGGYPQLDIVAIHIDYANRPESKAESDYVEHYCAQLGIRFFVRRIEEVTRGITSRDEYEQHSRQVRYNLYRKVAKECADNHHYSPETVVGVMLGHHRGDLRENVLSNAHKGCGPLDLSGMTSVSQNDGVTIFRPLLPLEKQFVFDYAHKYGVPYFKDTTPHWSTRGKLRNKLLPLLEEIYGEGSMNNLSTLAIESDECRELLHDALLKPFMDRVVRTPMGIVFETAPFVAAARGLFFWKFVLREVLHSAGLGMFSDKSAISFLERISPDQTKYKKSIREGWLQCRKDYAVYLQADGRVYVFYPDSFPWRKSDAYKCVGQVVDIKQQSTIAVGPWIVEAEVCGHGPDATRGELVKKKAVPSMDHFMEGFIEYYLECPAVPEKACGETGESSADYTPASLVFHSSFRKATRPPAWKNADEKLQETIPLLGISEAAFQELKSPAAENPATIVRITLDRRFSSD